jgi:cytochrome c553
LAFLPFAAGALSSGAQTGAISSTDVRLWAASCAACHGTNGKAEGAGLYLVRRLSKELYAKLIGYKDGTIPATIMHHHAPACTSMHQHAKGYANQKLLKIAGYFSAIK